METYQEKRKANQEKIDKLTKEMHHLEAKIADMNQQIRLVGEENLDPNFMIEYQENLGLWDAKKIVRDSLK